MGTVTEIAAGVYRISLFVPEYNLQFNQFVVVDEEPLLFHTGMAWMFPQVREAVATVIDPERLRWIVFSHFEVDECGALNRWLEVAPAAQGACSAIGAIVNMTDFAARPARGLADNEVLNTGQYRFQFLASPHLPHGWDAGLLFEQTQQTLFCSDLCQQDQDPVPLTGLEALGRVRQSLARYQKGPLRDVTPYSARTSRQLERLAALQPRTLAVMHGSTIQGDGTQALHELAAIMEEILA